MKYYIICACLVITGLLNACKQPAKAPAKKTDTVAVAKKTDTLPITPQVNNSADTVTEDECPSSPAEPVVKKNIFPDAKFTLQPDRRTGIETLTLPHGDKLILKQSGCEYYILSFRFETSRFMADTTNMAYWSNTALQLIREAAKGIDVPTDVDVAINKLAARIEKDKSGTGSKLELNEQIDFGGSDPRQYLTIDRISQLADQRYTIEVTLTYGPF